MTETHEPIKRWECYDPHEMGELADGEYVTYADHVAAIAAARAEIVTVDLRGDYNAGYSAGLIEGDANGRREGKRIGEADAFARGEAAMLARAVEAVEGLEPVARGIGMKDDLLAALAEMRVSNAGEVSKSETSPADATPKGLTDDH